MVAWRAMSVGDESPFPPAGVVRLPKGADGKSAVLVARSMGYLLIRVLFHGAPVVGVTVEYGRIDDEKDSKPEKLEPVVKTDADGLALFPRLVVAGIYGCTIERQPATVVPTVASLDSAYPVVLPVGRPLVDLGDVDEFATQQPGEASS
jgi:hypothetical protein